MNIVMTIISIGLASVYFVNCDLNDIAGINRPYDVSSSLTSLSASNGMMAECNAGCGCDTSTYDPVCINGLEYFSPCHAGCSSEIDPLTQTYSNCSCAGWTSASGHMNQTLTAVHGRCESECNKVYIFLPILGLYMFSTFFLMVPATTVVLRSVEDSQTTFAMALKQTIMRLFGAIPGPLLFGAILDNTCLLWQEKCGEDGSCWIYDNDMMGSSNFIIIVVGKIISLVALVAALKLYVSPSTGKNENEANSRA